MLTSTANVARNASAAPLAFLAKSVVSHAGLAFFTALFAVATLATSALIDRPFHYGMAGRLSKLYSVMVPVFLAILLIGAFIRMASVERPASPARHFARKIRGFACDSERLVGMAIMSALLVWFMAGFAFMKESIPALQPFDWDSTFRDWDRMLFGGVDPWRLTFAVFGTPAATTLINAAYHAWVFVIYMTLLVPQVIILESFLSYLGLGVQEPMSSWGVLISQGKDNMEGATWILIFPSLFLTSTLFALNFIGDGLRDALDPKDR